jgi:hypothetical protein
VSAYATGTTVTADRSRVELEKLLRRFGATGFGYAWQEKPARESVGFDLHGRQVRIDLPIPDPGSVEFTVTAAGRRRTDTAAEEAYQAEIRRRWRSLVLVVKAKLAAVADGISTVEREFLADIVLANGQTFADWAGPQFAALHPGQTLALTPGVER